ncbi:MAG: hypothetical protein JSW07_04960 [bacterium]|nr:MAG: hypothetical protein JSW07_04960 [bacterium]
MTLKKIQKELIKKCNSIVQRCETRTKIITKGHVLEGVASGSLSSTVPNSQLTHQQSKGTHAYKVTIDASFLEDIQSIITLAQNELVQEWHKYLDEVFIEALRLCLNDVKLHDRLPSMNLPLTELNVSRKPKIIESICIALREPFSFTKYHQKITKLEKLFAIKFESGTDLKKTYDETSYEVDKHVMIRNVFQHNRGIITSDDFENIGKQNKTITILDENGKKYSLAENQKILLSLPEIKYLFSQIKTYSSYFWKLP